MPDKPWKVLERKIAKIFGGERVKRWRNWGEEAADVEVPGLGRLKIDTKYRKKHGVHTWFWDDVKKYCKTDEDRVVLITKEAGCIEDELVTIDLATFCELLEAYKKVLDTGKTGCTLPACKSPDSASASGAEERGVPKAGNRSDAGGASHRTSQPRRRRDG